MEHAYLIRYGLMRRVGQFLSESNTYARGQSVVIRTHRGTELGEVLLEVTAAQSSVPAVGSARVLRAACEEDLDFAARVDDERSRRFALCQGVFQDGVWPIELIDAEPLLDERRTVLHYLGPHNLDVAGLRLVLRERCGLDVVLEAVGRDAPPWPEEVRTETEEAHSCGSCGADGAGGCGSGGCGDSEGSHGGGCSDCGVKKLLSTRRTAATT